MADLSGHKPLRRAPRNTALSDEAIEWVVLLHSGTAGAADREGYAQWRVRSPAHEEAACEAEALLGDVGRTQAADEYRLTGTALGPPAYRERARRFGRRAFVGSAVAAGAAWIAGPALVAGVTALLATYHTGVGERRRLRLPDGSTVWLNTASALSVHFGVGSRRITLHAGEALFDVAKDRARLFIVHAGQGAAEAVGTVYAVRREGAATRVTVQEGIVAVRDGESVQRVMAGQGVRYRDGMISAPDSVETDEAFSWVRGKLIFNRRPLEQVTAELERYRHGRILILGEELRKMDVTGVFDLDDNEALLAALGSATGARVTHLPFLIVIRANA